MEMSRDWRFPAIQRWADLRDITKMSQKARQIRVVEGARQPRLRPRRKTPRSSSGKHMRQRQWIQWHVWSKPTKHVLLNSEIEERLTEADETMRSNQLGRIR